MITSPGAIKSWVQGLRRGPKISLAKASGRPQSFKDKVTIKSRPPQPPKDPKKPDYLNLSMAGISTIAGIGTCVATGTAAGLILIAMALTFLTRAFIKRP